MGCDDTAPAAQADVVESQDAVSTTDATATEADAQPTSDVAGNPLCENFAGIYVTQTSCTVGPVHGAPEEIIPEVICINQTGCTGRTWLEPTESLSWRSGPAELVFNKEYWGADSDSWPNGCGGTINDGELAFDCTDSATALTQCTGNATRVAVTGATSYCCDPIAQDCATGEYCAFVHVEGSFRGATACLPSQQLKAAGESCARVNGTGTDDCGPGLGCSETGVQAGPICQRACADTIQCDSGERCVFADNFGSARDWVGLCHTACDLTGAACPDGLSCAILGEPQVDAPEAGVWLASVCERVGERPAGSACGDQILSCEPGTYCNVRPLEFSCEVPCREPADCAEGETCVGVEFHRDSFDVDGIGSCRVTE